MNLPPQVQRARSLAQEGRAAEAVQMLRQLAEKGDGPASFELAEWFREGAILPRDFAAARMLYSRSAEAGLIEGARRSLALMAAGVGGPRDWPQSLVVLGMLANLDPDARRQLELLDAMAIDRNGDPQVPPESQTVRESPRIQRFPGLLTQAECQYLVQAAEPLFEPAETVEEVTSRTFRNPIRTSDTAVFPWVGENPAIHALNRRIAAASGTDWAQGEPLQVLRYSPGQEYRPHIDAIPGLSNQRVATMLIYLNDGFEGGETQFVDLDICIEPRPGDAILFCNVDPDGEPDQRLKHAGLPVQSGVKFLASRWIRERPAEA